MAEPLAGVRLKVERAKAHLAELEESIGAALKPDAEHFLGEFDTESKHHIYRAQNLPVLDPEWALQAGEVTYQLRSALDHLAWQLVEREGTTPNGQTQFPIRDSLLGKKQQLLPLKTLLPLANDCKVLQVLNECQPYYGDGTRELSPPDAHRHPLWILKVASHGPGELSGRSLRFDRQVEAMEVRPHGEGTGMKLRVVGRLVLVIASADRDRGLLEQMRGQAVRRFWAESPKG